jgi:DUF917 family protein
MNEILKYGNILLYGCGGGYDIYTSVPLYLELKKQHKNVEILFLMFR